MRFHHRFKLSVLAAALSCVLANTALAEVEISEEARQRFRVGVSLLQDPEGPRYEEAYHEFTAAYAASPSWKILGNLGLCAMKLERDGEAIEAFSKYLAEGGDQIGEEERRQIQTDLDTLRTGAVTFTLSISAPGALLVDERVPNRGTPVINHYGPVDGTLTFQARAGLHRIRARLAGYEDAVWEIHARAGTRHTHLFNLVPVKKAEPSTGPQDAGIRPVPPSVYIGLATTGVFAAGAALTGLLAVSKGAEYEAANDGTNPGRAEDLRSGTQTMNLATDVLMGAAVVSAGITAYLYFTRPTLTTRSGRVEWTPVLAPGTGMMSLSGSF